MAQNQELYELFDDYVDKSKKEIINLGNIQALRGIAALMVAFAHLHSVESKLGNEIIFGDWALFGFAGVDLFFVISGFIMFWVNHNDFGNSTKLKPFFTARIMRIYPLWWLICGAVIALYLIRPDMVYSGSNFKPDLIKSFFLIPQSVPPIHAIGWTLIHELWFYFAFSLLFLLPKKAFIYFICSWLSIIIILSISGIVPLNSFLNLITHPLTIEFIIGAIIGSLISKKIYPIPLLISLIGGGLLLFAISNIGINPTQFFEDRNLRVLYFALPFAFLVWGFVGLELKGNKISGFLCSLGDWSYALYLVHVLVFSAIGRIAKPLATNGYGDNIIITAIAIISTIFVSFLLHKYFEKPIIKIGKNIYRN